MEKEKSAKMILEEAFEKVNFSKLSSGELADLREYIEVKIAQLKYVQHSRHRTY